MAHDALGAHARDELGISTSFSARPIQAASARALVDRPVSYLDTEGAAKAPYPCRATSEWDGQSCPGVPSGGGFQPALELLHLHGAVGHRRKTYRGGGQFCPRLAAPQGFSLHFASEDPGWFHRHFSTTTKVMSSVCGMP